MLVAQQAVVEATSKVQLLPCSHYYLLGEPERKDELERALEEWASVKLALLQAYGLAKYCDTGCWPAEIAGCLTRALADGHEVQMLSARLHIYQSLGLH